jgi:hypothetical protein
VLIASSSASVLGNVTHAILNPHAGNTVVAAVAAVIPPAVLLAATHGLALMVRSSITGAMYRYALWLLVALSVCAFVLSFDALSELAIHQGGMPRAIAWLWPLAIDVSVAQSTLALLAITTGKSARREAAEAVRTPRKRAPAKAKAVRKPLAVA